MIYILLSKDADSLYYLLVIIIITNKMHIYAFCRFVFTKVSMIISEQHKKMMIFLCCHFYNAAHMDRNYAQSTRFLFIYKEELSHL